MDIIRIGTRSSKLALWQANLIALILSTKYPDVEVKLVHVTTKGDKILDAPLSKIGGKGLFTKELEVQMLEGKVDLAVHSLKDVPVELPPEFTIAAVTKRAEPFDALVSNKYKSFEELPNGAKIGTSSLRRRAQLLAVRPDLQIDNLRGNVDTRLKKLDEGDFDAIILAAAGLKRLGHERRIAEILPPSLMLPAVGQGALAIETLTDNAEILNMLKFLDDADTRATTSAERAFLEVVEGGCQVPVGVFGAVEGDSFDKESVSASSNHSLERRQSVIPTKKITVEAVIASIDGQRIIRDKLIGSVEDSTQLGKTLANKLLDNGGREILSAVIGQTL